MKNNPRYIFIHCTDTPSRKGVSQFDAVNQYHKSGHPLAPFPISSLGYHGGYQKIITNGHSLRYRLDTDQGAHCNKVVDGISMNFQSVAVALGIDGDRELPNDIDTALLVADVKEWQAIYGIPNERVKFHRDYDTLKTCPGNLVTREWLSEKMGWRKTSPIPVVTKPPMTPKQARSLIRSLKLKVEKLLKKLKSKK